MLLIHTADHYSLVFDVGTAPRAPLPTDGMATEAQIVAAWTPVVAEAGTYQATGNTITYTRIVSKDPASMLPANATYERTYQITGNMLETRATNAAGVTAIFRYRRVE